MRCMPLLRGGCSCCSQGWLHENKVNVRGAKRFVWRILAVRDSLFSSQRSKSTDLQGVQSVSGVIIGAGYVGTRLLSHFSWLTIQLH